MTRVLGLGIGALGLGLAIVSSYSGTLIDFSGKRYREYTSISGFKFGEWTTLPLINTVKVVSISFMHTNNPNGISPTFSGKVTDFRLVLYSNASEPILSFVYTKRAKAVQHARNLATGLNADLVIDIPDRE
ncbi:hypothetical protein OKW21_002574 [Catalinimonas alkaloidigena]|uniref:hypothetical protein n=1 Tax=Catalinimonas alkaloidigena TaxID=1075417 RepID=UPI0024077453|nr:hypothetical protein [Catalinimonas alkaloidigena]MDF9797311.1 hypothetical protein [Catalinimonas alkaloidigena]